MRPLSTSHGHRAALLLAAALALLACGRPPERLVVLHFNDFHGRYEPFSAREDRGELGGAARFVATVDQARAEAEGAGAHHLLVVAGDMFTGTPMSGFYAGEVEAALLELLMPLVLTLGNHDFDFGQERALELFPERGYPVLCANCVVERSGELLTGQGMVVEEIGAYRVAIIGIVTPDTAFVTMPDNVEGIHFADPVEAVSPLAARARDEGVDAVILVNHAGVAMDSRLAREVEGVDLIVSGHDHRLLTEPVMEAGVPIVQAGSKGRWLGRVELELGEGGARLLSAAVLPVTPEVGEAPRVVELLSRYQGGLDAEMEREVGTTLHRLVGHGGRDHETNLGDLITDAMRAHTGTDIAFINGGGIRADIEPGAITVGDVMTSLPFPNTLVTFELTGAQLREVLAFSGAQRGRGAFLQLSGVEVIYDASGAPSSIRVGGAELEEDARYSVTSLNFLTVGGDGYAMLDDWLDDTSSRDTGVLIYHVVSEYIRGQGEIDQPAPAGRVSFASEAP